MLVTIQEKVIHFNALLSGTSSNFCNHCGGELTIVACENHQQHPDCERRIREIGHYPRCLYNSQGCKSCK